MPGKLKLAIAGLGLVGKRHVDAIHQSGVADLCGVVEPTHDGSVRHQRTHRALLRFGGHS